MKCTINSLYLCVKNIDRAIDFYERFFEIEVTEKDDIYSVFDVNGFRLGLFNYQKMKEYHIYGSNCIPSIEVETLQILKRKISNLKVVFPLKVIGNNYVCEFEDSEGNHIELTTQFK